MGLGIYPSVSLQEARDKRYSAKKKLEIDVDPAEDKKLKKSNTSLSSLCSP
jgi:hypothetical protein